MANEQNLIPQAHKLTVEEASKGGKASGEARRRERTIRETLEKLLALPIKDENTKDYIRDLGFNDEELDNRTALIIAMYQEVLKGNTKAFELIRDTIGEKPTDRLQIEERPVIRLERPKK